MASKRRDRRRSCESKIRYADATAAGAAAYNGRQRGERIGFYPCRHCSGWHIGHPPKHVREAIASRTRAARRRA